MTGGESRTWIAARREAENSLFPMGFQGFSVIAHGCAQAVVKGPKYWAPPFPPGTKDSLANHAAEQDPWERGNMWVVTGQGKEGRDRGEGLPRVLLEDGGRLTWCITLF